MKSPLSPHKAFLSPTRQVNEVVDDKAVIKAMQAEIEALRRQLVSEGRGWAVGEWLGKWPSG